MKSLKTSLVLIILVITIGLKAQQKPNIIFLFSDDQTIAAMGCYGNKDIFTPNLDQLAKEGVRFVNHYNTTAICMASRANVMTGLYEYRNGCNFGHGDLNRELFNNSYPNQLKKAGYFTGFAGKIGFEIEDEEFETFEKDFDVWAGGPAQTLYETEKNKGIAKYAEQYPHCSRAYGAWGQDFIKSAKESGKPFCMSISFKAPHLPFTPDPIDLKLYDANKKYTRPANYGVENGTHLSPQSQTTRAATKYREWITDYDKTVRLYYALITGVDAAVGMLREQLVREGIADNTIIIFTSDNGYNSGSHGFGDKILPYEEGSKSPLIIYDPRLPKEKSGKVCEAITANVDMTATIYAISGVKAPMDIDGKNLMPLLSNPSEKVRDYLPLFNFWGIKTGQSMAIVTPEWKYIYWYSGENGMKPQDELFQLKSDRVEMKNVANNPENKKVLSTLKKNYDKELSSIATKTIKGYSYESFAQLFDRNLPWEQKKDLAQDYDGSPRKMKNSK